MSYQTFLDRTLEDDDVDVEQALSSQDPRGTLTYWKDRLEAYLKQQDLANKDDGYILPEPCGDGDEPLPVTICSAKLHDGSTHKQTYQASICAVVTMGGVRYLLLETRSRYYGDNPVFVMMFLQRGASVFSGLRRLVMFHVNVTGERRILQRERALSLMMADLSNRD